MWSEQCVSVDSMPQHRQKYLYYSPCGWGLGGGGGKLRELSAATLS